MRAETVIKQNKDMNRVSPADALALAAVFLDGRLSKHFQGQESKTCVVSQDVPHWCNICRPCVADFLCSCGSQPECAGCVMGVYGLMTSPSRPLVSCLSWPRCIGSVGWRSAQTMMARALEIGQMLVSLKIGLAERLCPKCWQVFRAIWRSIVWL